MRITWSFLFTALILVGCFTDKPSQKEIDEFVKTKFRSESYMGSFTMVTKRYDNVKVLNQWADENAKAVYYIKVSFDYEDNWFRSSCVQTWRLVRQGDQWEPGKYPVEKDCKDRGGKGLFQR